MHSSVLNQTYPTSQSVNFSERRPRANQMRILYNKPALNIPPTMLQPKPLAKHQIRSNFFLKGHHFDLSIPFSCLPACAAACAAAAMTALSVMGWPTNSRSVGDSGDRTMERRSSRGTHCDPSVSQIRVFFPGATAWATWCDV